MNRDPLFKALTRPAMFLGVPLTPFYFNFHQTRMGRDDRGDMHLGHTLILGKSGTGKTVLATFLLSQLTAFSRPETFLAGSANKKLTAIYLDKDYGAEIAIRAMGGQYNRLKNGLPAMTGKDINWKKIKD